MQFETKSTDFVGKYLKRVQKRIAGKPLAVQLIMDRTFGTATWVLQLIENVPFQKNSWNWLEQMKKSSFWDSMRFTIT